MEHTIEINGGESAEPFPIAGISVLSEATSLGPEEAEDFPDFQANDAQNTPRWPFNFHEFMPGSGTLVYDDGAKNMKVTLHDFVIFGQLALGDGEGVDLGTDGSPDLVSQFTLKIEPIDPSFECILPPPQFRRGDSDGDGPVTNLSFQFVGNVDPPCLDALDFDDSGNIDVSDPIANLSHQFLGLEPPAPPAKESCGEDPTPDKDGKDLGCEDYPEHRC